MFRAEHKEFVPEELQSGCMYGDIVLRVAMVKVERE